MPRLSKTDRMTAVEELMGQLDLDDLAVTLAELAAAAETANEAREEIVSAAAEALDRHEARDWDGRGDSLETMSEALERLEEGLETLEATPVAELAVTLTDGIERLRKAADEAREHAVSFAV